MRNLIIFLGLLLITSCKKDFNSGQSDSEKTPASLSKDKNFQQLITRFAKLDEKITDPESLKQMISDGKLSDDEINRIHKLYGYQSKNDFFNDCQNLFRDLRSLDEVYGFSRMSSFQKEREVKEAFKLIAQSQPAPGFEHLSMVDGRCETIYNSTLLSIAAQATVAHVGCALADATIVVGLICHAAVGTYQVAETRLAKVAYNDCLQGH